MQVRVESGDASVAAASWDNVLLVAAGTSPYHLVDAAVIAAAEMCGELMKLNKPCYSASPLTLHIQMLFCGMKCMVHVLHSHLQWQPGVMCCAGQVGPRLAQPSSCPTL